MKAHGAKLSLDAGEYRNLGPSAQTSSAYRNLFGDAGPNDRYKGFVAKDRNKSREMFGWLAERLGQSYPWDDANDQNLRIPAGYTYLAQFVIHDSVQSLNDLPSADTDWLRNDRSGRLVLDTIYGKGPSSDPLLFGTSPGFPRAGGFLRIGGRGDAGDQRDLPRSPCPFAGKPAYSDVLIADARNDDNVIVAQITVLFHLFHNMVYGQLYNRLQKEASDARIFALARKVVTAVYRKIVMEDLLARILLPEVYQHYSGERKPVFFDVDDPRMPLEFSHAAARFGHFMVRGDYQINRDLSGADTGLRSILQQTSALRPDDMPLKRRWLVEWRRLFGDPGPELLYSQRLGPELARVLLQNELFPDRDAPREGHGGLAFFDFVRGSEFNLRSVATLVQLLPGWVKKLSTLVSNTGGIDPNPLARWLETEFRTLRPPSPQYIQSLKDDMPLLLFIMLEAAETPDPKGDPHAKGQCLGAIGSFILAEFFFREYWRTHDLIEGDASVTDAFRHIFPGGQPATMMALIAAITERSDLETREESKMQSDDWKRMELIDPILMGKIIVKWSLYPKTRPKVDDFNDFKEQVKDALKIVSPTVTNFQLIETGEDVIGIRLPPATMLEKAQAAYGAPTATVKDYPFPSYLHVDHEKIEAEGTTPLDLFYASVGDYTTKECE